MSFPVTYTGDPVMSDGRHESELREMGPIEAQYTARSAARGRTTSSSRRLVFFGIASIWGFIVGMAGVLAAMSLAGQHLQPDVRVGLSLVPAFLLAAAGGLVVAAAYKESKRRSQ